MISLGKSYCQTITTKKIIISIWSYACILICPSIPPQFHYQGTKSWTLLCTADCTAQRNSICTRLGAQPDQLSTCIAPVLALFARQQNLQPFPAPRRDSSCLLQGKGRISTFGSLGLSSSCVPDQTFLLFPNNSRKTC